MGRKKHHQATTFFDYGRVTADFAVMPHPLRADFVALLHGSCKTNSIRAL
jgi:hypothetical protein